MLGQTFEIHDLAVIGLLIVLEGVLSIDNALVLGLLAKRLPKPLQNKALTYGLVGAFVFRFIAIATAAYLLHWRIVKLLGGLYLVYVAVKHFIFESEEHEKVTVDKEGSPVLVDGQGHELTGRHEANELGSRMPIPLNYQGLANAGGGTASFWPTVVVIELTDIAFAVDSIVAAIGVVGAPPPGVTRHPKLWVVMLGGFLGVALMRYAATLFIKLLDRFPRFEMAAYLLVTVIGGKLIVDWGFNSPPADWPVGQPFHGPVDFHSPSSPAFWVFWLTMLLSFCVGFIPTRKQANS